MLRQKSRNGITSASRRMLGVFVIMSLNLAAMPCTMALEVNNPKPHCPPPAAQEMAHEDAQSPPGCLTMQSDCCGLEEAATDYRSGVEKSPCDTSPMIAGVPSWPSLHTVKVSKYDIKPPDPDGHYPPLNVLLCVYLD